MNERTLRALVEAGAVKRVRIVAEGAHIHVEADTATGCVVASTSKGAVKTWGSFDAAAKWVRGLGIGTVQLELAKWQAGQRGLRLSGAAQGSMGMQRARKLAQNFAGVQAELTLLEDTGSSVYGMDRENNFYFLVSRPGEHRTASSECVAVSKSSGAVRSAGRVGE